MIVSLSLGSRPAGDISAIAVAMIQEGASPRRKLPPTAADAPSSPRMLIPQHLLHLCIILHKVLIGRHGDVLSCFCLRTSRTRQSRLCGADKNHLNANKEQKFAAAARTRLRIAQEIRRPRRRHQAGWDACHPLSHHRLRFCLEGLNAPLICTAAPAFPLFTLVSIANTRARVHKQAAPFTA